MAYIGLSYIRGFYTLGEGDFNPHFLGMGGVAQRPLGQDLSPPQKETIPA